MENITFDMVIVCLVVVLAIVSAYNMIATARKNAREERKRREEPSANNTAAIREIQDKIVYFEHKLDEHDKRLNDNRSGTMVLCAGVQALLEHELHNGNSEEMQAASKDISAWLLKR